MLEFLSQKYASVFKNKDAFQACIETHALGLLVAYLLLWLHDGTLNFDLFLQELVNARAWHAWDVDGLLSTGQQSVATLQGHRVRDAWHVCSEDADTCSLYKGCMCYFGFWEFLLFWASFVFVCCTE